MKKTMKKVLSLALALVLAVGAMVIAPVNAKADEYTAALSFCDSSWGSGMWADADGSTTTVTGDGSYTVGWTVPEGTATVPDAGVFVIDFAGAQAAMDESNTTWEVTALTVKVDGNEVPVDVSKLLTGDLEGNGNYRIEIYNMVGAGTADNPPLDNTAVTFSQSLQVDFTIKTVEKAADGADDTTDDTTEDTITATFDPAGTYNAYIGLQTPSWSFRNDYTDASYGINSDVWNQITGWDENNAAVVREGTIHDTVIAGNGTYSVSVDGLGDWVATELATSADGIFNLLFISTDIPYTEDVTITDVKLIIDGSTRHTDAEAYINPEVTDHIQIVIQNIWNADKAEISYYNAPSESIEMQFTISGFNYDKAADETSTEGTSADTNTNTGSDANNDGGNNILPIVIVVVVVVVAVVAVVVVKKNKKAE